MLFRNVINGVNTVLIRREVFEKVGLFDENINGAEDWEMWVRISNRYEIHTVRKYLAFYLKHSENTSHNLQMMMKENQKAIDKVIKLFKNELSEQEIKRIKTNHMAYYLPSLYKSKDYRSFRALYEKAFREYPLFILEHRLTWILKYIIARVKS